MMKSGEGLSGLANVSEKGRKPSNEFVNRRPRVQIPSPAPIFPESICKGCEGHRPVKGGALQTPRKTAVLGKSVALRGKNSIFFTHPFFSPPFLVRLLWFRSNPSTEEN